MRPVLAKLKQLPASERRLLLALAMLQPLASASLRLSGYKTTLDRIERLSRHPGPRASTPDELQQAHRLAQLAAMAGKHGLVTTTCLRQALVVHGLLRKRGLQPRLRLGVGAIEATPDMHAWVELDGVALAQPNLRHRGF